MGTKMRTLLLVFVLVACLALAFAENEQNEESDKSCGPGDDPQGVCMRCRACKKNKSFNLCHNKKAKKECKKAKGKGFCCCYDSDDTLPAICAKKSKKASGSS